MNWTPAELSPMDVGFGPTGGVSQLMPAYADIPREFKDSNNAFNRVASHWFCAGLNPDVLVEKEGVDRTRAIRHLKTIQGSWEPPHEHKEAAVAFLMSEWFTINPDCPFAPPVAGVAPKPRRPKNIFHTGPAPKRNPDVSRRDRAMWTGRI